MGVWALILASGEGKRAETVRPKQFVPIGGRTPVERCLDVFEAHPRIDSILLVIHPGFVAWALEMTSRNGYHKLLRTIPGGKTRQESSWAGVQGVNEGGDESFVLIHDAVRPFVSHDLINGCLSALGTQDAVVPVLPATETLVTVDESGRVRAVPERSRWMRVQTPQGFRTRIIKKAHQLAGETGRTDFTDDSGMVREFNLASIQTIPGDRRNIKITYPEDIWLAERLSEEER